ncbi:hypothetical protein [Nonomuraea turkmeniaca]|uniref:hypothetical protein n=1 Tax=Nonomuraea turkmeniaca TaxID=103838 RepID=UPI00110B644A|nr:hypothetical protein [Nonomuraea turkmeniaca]
MKRRFSALLIAAVASTAVAVTGGAAQAAPSSAAGEALAPKLLKFGQSVVIKGERGGRLRVTPTGVYYHRTRADDSPKPVTKYFTAVAFTVQVLDKADRLSPPVAGGQWAVRAGGRVFDTSSGNAVQVPWIGRVPEGVQRTDKGDKDVVIESFDLPGMGGVLQWKDRSGGSFRWQMPRKTSGKNLEPVHEALKAYYGE